MRFAAQGFLLQVVSFYKLYLSAFGWQFWYAL